MALTLDTNNGLAFYNSTGLERSDKAPTFKGEIDIEGKRYEVVVWLGKTKKGTQMVSMKVEDAVAAQIERAERRLDYLRNQATSA
jgi:hypothetical protein